MQTPRAYFEDRKNRVKVNEAVASWKEQLRGCPQGSSFGPLLWNLFQNDLCHHVETDNLFMYADDHQMYLNGKNIEPVASALKKEAENVSQWYKANLLQANPKKYQILVMAPRLDKKDVNERCTLPIGSQEIKPKRTLKILGVNMDDQLSFSDNISDVCKKATGWWGS